VRAAASSAAAAEVLADLGQALEAEQAGGAPPETVSECDAACWAQAAVVEAARRLEQAQAELDAAQAQAAGDPDNAQAQEAVAAAAAAVAAAAAALARAMEDSAGTTEVMRAGLQRRHGAVQEAADSAGVLADRRFLL
jgi:predicted S18 family serine protease